MRWVQYLWECFLLGWLPFRLLGGLGGLVIAVFEVLGGLQHGGVLLRLILRVVDFLFVVGGDIQGVARLQNTNSRFFLAYLSSLLSLQVMNLPVVSCCKRNQASSSSSFRNSTASSVSSM